MLTAVCAGTGAASGLISPELNVAVVNLFLEQFSRELAAGVHAVLLWDGAGYHTGEDLVVPANVSLIQLLPYSPELNPVENLWHYLRSHYWSKRVYRDYDALQEAAIGDLACGLPGHRRRSRLSAMHHTSAGAHRLPGKRS